MDSFNTYQFAKISNQDKELISQLEQTISIDGKKIVLIAYESK